jgi:hypothetical protein
MGAGIGPLQAAPADAGMVLTEAGPCFLESGGVRTPLKTGDSVHVGDMVEVPLAARLKLRMTDGSVISAASGTRVKIESYNPGGA